MEEKICYFNGEYIKESEAKISIRDMGVLEGSVFDAGRTFNHVPFKLKEHVDRLFSSVRALPFMHLNLTPEEVCNITLEVFKRNEKLLSPEDDFMTTYRVTRGVEEFWRTPTGGTFYISVRILDPQLASYADMVKWYQEGTHLVVAKTRHIPPQCLDPRIKHSNRLVQSLAQFEAQGVDPEAFALLLDIHGFATECEKYNFFMVKNERLLTSKPTSCLGGITRQTVIELAKKLKIEFIETDLSVYDLYNADEIMLTATSFSIIPVFKFNERVMKKPIPGPITKQLQSAFSQLVNYDIVERVVSYVRARQKATV